MQSRTGLIFFPAFDWAISKTHPEREERLLYTRDQIFEEGIMDLPGVEEYTPRVSDFHDIARVHFCIPSVRSQVTEAHLIASGAALQLGDAVMSGEIKNGFALVRPPGHHAMKVVHGNRGFCNINNEAILVDYLRSKYGLKKIAIVDSDVHHGDGTQNIFYHDPDVLYISFHQDGRTLFPGTGFTNELGGPQAYGTTLNIPLPPGMCDETMDNVVSNLVLPVLEDFQPELIINSAGQDNHYSDPLANMRFTSKGYGRFTEKLKPDIAVLEGGYGIEGALPYVNLAIILALTGFDYSYVSEPDYDPELFKEKKENVNNVQQTIEYIRKTWDNRYNIDLNKIFGSEKYYKRRKSIFYDTDFINEEQVEKVKRCTNCSGYNEIESKIRDDVKVYCVSIPFYACGSCRDQAYEGYYRAKALKQYDYVFLQDKYNDVCLYFNNESSIEEYTEG
ncbi:MAG: histone deacetylase [Clostridiales bacterium]|nr:histone deacetylase [Clostridiales bacterium]MCF8023266.1 histone deacetylase [Clostridiales bacterium]